MSNYPVDSAVRPLRSITIAPLVGIPSGAIFFLLVSQVSSSWMDSQSPVTLLLMATVVAAAVLGAWLRPMIATWAGVTAVFLIVAGFVLGVPSDVMGPTNLLEPLRLAQHGGRSAAVVASASATLTVALLRRSQARIRT